MRVCLLLGKRRSVCRACFGAGTIASAASATPFRHYYELELGKKGEGGKAAFHYTPFLVRRATTPFTRAILLVALPPPPLGLCRCHNSTLLSPLFLSPPSPLANFCPLVFITRRKGEGRREEGISENEREEENGFIMEDIRVD